MSGTKPEYKVPSMREIERIPWNGYNVVSTFSGGGGSCLGYRMAGYHVLYANEFVEEAQRTYRANHPGTYLDCRDIRTVTAEDILEKIGKKKSEIDLFDGSPPCCAFSTAGKREAGWGKEREYSDGKTQRIEDLFEEYIRLLNGLQPKTFVAENVSGMVKGKAIGYFKEYLRKMKNCGYKVSARLLNAKYLGVPQSRERIIFVGVRNDIELEPPFPTPSKTVIPLAEAFKDLEQDEAEREKLLADYDPQFSAIGRELRRLPKNPYKIVSSEKYFNLCRESMLKPCSTITQLGGCAAGPCHPIEDRRFTIPELKRITSIPDDFILTGEYKQRWERLGRMVPPIMMMNIAKTIQTNVLDVISK